MSRFGYDQTGHLDWPWSDFWPPVWGSSKRPHLASGPRLLQRQQGPGLKGPSLNQNLSIGLGTPLQSFGWPEQADWEDYPVKVFICHQDSCFQSRIVGGGVSSCSYSHHPGLPPEYSGSTCPTIANLFLPINCIQSLDWISKPGLIAESVGQVFSNWS